MKEKEIKLFIRFLKDNNSYLQFKKNFYLARKHRLKNNSLTYQNNGFLADYLINNEPYYYFTCAFLWSNTNEGAYYWESQSSLWRKQLLM